tara:strand:+ start:133 stop:2568 length:2436 start_codon:yes stop_codon:yes gene_type:complete
MIGLMVPNAFSATTTFDEGEEKIILEKNIDVNLVLIGDSWLSSQVTAIKKDLVETYEPIYLLTNKKVGIKYNFEYNFLAVTEEDSKKLFENIGEGLPQELNGPIAWWLYTYQGIPFDAHNEAVEQELLWQYDAEHVEKQIYELIIKDDSNLSSNDNINLVFLSSSEDYFPWKLWKNYFIVQKDSSTDMSFQKIGLTGYGGNYNFYYFDLYAMPWIELDLEGLFDSDDPIDWFYYPVGMGNLHDCTDASCFSEIIVEDVNSAIHHIATPSLVYPVDYYPNYLIDLVVYNAPMGSSTGITKSTISYFVDEDKVISELNKLYPFANFEMDISTERRDTRGISLEFKDAIKSMQYEILETPFTDYSYSALNSEKIKPHLIEWAQERIASKNIENTKTIPVILVTHNSSRDLFIDDYGTTGYAPGMPEDDTISCCAFAVIHEDQVWKNKLSGTDLVIHEVGHTLGLAHPFQTAIGEHYEFTENDFWNNYASPMTYGSVHHGCGILFDILHPDEICGLADRSFTVFETNAITNMAVASLIKKTNQNIDDMEPSEIDNSKLKSIQNNLSNAVSSFNTGKILQKNGAIDNAKIAYFDSKEMLGERVIITEFIQPDSKFGETKISKTCLEYDKYSIMSLNVSGMISNEIFSKGQPIYIHVTETDGNYDQTIKIISKSSGGFNSDYIFSSEIESGSYQIQFEHMDEKSTIHTLEISEKCGHVEPEIFKKSETAIPEWIKNNAGWWAEGQIDDNSFVQGIQFMIKQNIISIPNLPESSSETAESVPAWVKNNAGWWAEGQIDDNSFVQGIEYLVKVGIIQVT